MLINPEGPVASEGPQPLLRPIPAGEPYPVEALGPLRDAAEAVQGKTLAPIEIPAQSALSIAALAVQGFADVETLGGKSPVSLYAMTIAESGSRKSSADRLLLAALRDHERVQAQAPRSAMVSWQNRLALWKGERDRILAEAKNKGLNLDAAEADLNALGPEPAAPPSAERLVTEPTYEGLVRLLATGQPSLAIYSDEGGQFLGGHAMNGENRQKTLAGLNDLWGGNPIRRTRSGEGSSTLYGRRLSVHLMVQPRVATIFMADSLAADTGFLPRFLMCQPPSTIGTRFQARVHENPRALEAFSSRLHAILETPQPMDAETRELDPRLLRLSPRSKELLVHYSDDVELRQAPGGNFAHVPGYASKAAEQAARIAGVLTLWRDLEATMVEPEEMAWGIMLADYYLTEASRLADAASVSEEIQRAETLGRWILEKWPYDEILPADVLQRAPVRALRDRPAARRAIATLVEAGWLEQLTPGSVVRGKKRREAYRVVRPVAWPSEELEL